MVDRKVYTTRARTDEETLALVVKRLEQFGVMRELTVRQETTWYAQDLLDAIANDVVRVEACPKCGHAWTSHDQEIRLAPVSVGDPDPLILFECEAYAGMSDWCGCPERSRQPTPS